jgi:ATP-binding cassette subfamily B multidrug efflux pump
MSSAASGRPSGPAGGRGPMRPHGGGNHPHAARMMGQAGPVEKPLAFRSSFRRVLTLLAPDRQLIVAIAAFGVISVALAVTGPALLGHATDVIVKGVFGEQLTGTTQAQAVQQLRADGNNQLAQLVGSLDVEPGASIAFGVLGRVLLLVLAVYAAGWAFGVMQARLTTLLVQRTVYRLREQVATKLTRLPLSYFDGQPRGEVLSRATNDADNLAQTLQQTLSQLMTSLLTIVGVLAMMLWLSPLLALIAVATVPVSVWVTTTVAKRSQPRFVEQWQVTGSLNGHVEEMITGHALVQIYGRQQEAIERFEADNRRLYETSWRAQFLSGLIQPSMMFIGNVQYVLIAVVGALRVSAGAMSIGDVQAFIQYSRQFSQPLTQVASMANLVQSGVASAERIFQVLDAAEQSPDPVTAQRPAQLRGRVQFEDVSFRYADDTPLIDGLSLTVEPGQTVAIVGPTGAGKTTLVNLLMRFYELRSGRILLDGVDIAAMRREELRDAMGMVLQDTWLFRGTIEDNLGYGADQPTHEQIVHAATAARADRFIRTLPDGYATLVDDEGGRVSAGEQQLITIARALLSEPSILILDEATSSVDTRTEVLIQQAMRTLRSGRTSFVIAHRLSTIRDADIILVMERGAIVEHGTHDALMAAGGAYSRLYAAQFAAAPGAA